VYALWFVLDGPRALQGSGSVRVNVTAVPAYVADAAAGAVAALFGLGLNWGRPLLVLLLIVALLRARRPPSTRLVSLVVTAIAFWTLVALARAHFNEPAASRYLYFGAVLVLLTAAELLRGMELPARAPLIVAAVAVFAVIANVHLLRRGAREIRAFSDFLRPELAALEIAGPGVPADFRPDPTRAPHLVAGRYLDAVRQLGSPAESPRDLLGEPEPQREAADAVLLAALGVRLAPASSGVAVVAGCDRGASVDVTRSELAVVVEAPPRAPAEVFVRRFADLNPRTPLGLVPPAGRRRLMLPRRHAPGPWRVRVSSASGSVAVCGTLSR
jgi:hypothetical protein